MAPSVVVAPLEIIHAVGADEVHDAVFLSQAARPEAWTEVLERLGLADPGKWLPKHRLDNRKRS